MLAEIARWSAVVAFFVLADSNILGGLQNYLAYAPQVFRPWLKHAHEYVAVVGVALIAVHVWALLLSINVVSVLGHPAAMWGMFALLLLASIIFVWFERKKFGILTWFILHSLNFVAFLAIAVHGWIAGPDLWMRPFYIGAVALTAMLMVSHFNSWRSTIFRLAGVAIVCTALVTISLPIAHVHPFILTTCVLQMPANALSNPTGIYYLQPPCHEENPNEAAFVQLVVFDPATATLSAYTPLVLNRGAPPFIAPHSYNIPPNAVVGIWFGSNAPSITLTGMQGADCVNSVDGFDLGQFAYCNAVAFYAAVNAALSAGRLAIPTIGIGFDDLPCATTRSAEIVDQDQSDNLPVTQWIVNGHIMQNTAINRAVYPDGSLDWNPSDNVLMQHYNQALGCSTWNIPDMTDPGALIATQATNEILANAQPGLQMLVPLADPMTGTLAKVAAYRLGVDQPLDASSDTQAYCQNIADFGVLRLNLDRPWLQAAASLLPVASNLFTFLAQRLQQTWNILGCHGPNPVTLVVDADGIVIGASIA